MKMFYCHLFFVSAVLFSSSLSIPSKQQIPLQENNRSPFTAEFDEAVTHLLNQWHVPGLSIAVIDGDETFSKGYGISSYSSSSSLSNPVTASTLFYTGSTTKAFTAAALALLIDDSANSTSPLSWTTSISSLIRSDFVLPDEYATLHAMLEDAASHRTGMPGHDASYGDPNSSLRDVVRNLRNLPMTAEIRQKFQYCNMMYMTLSHVIETLTSSWLGDVLRDRIWNPLNMTRTYFSLGQAQRSPSDLAKGYMWSNRTQSYVEIPYMDIPFVSGAGNVISNVEDYARWLRFLISQSPPLSERGHQSLRNPRTILEDSPLPGFVGPSTYALGWNVENYRGEPLISHTGGVPGFGALVGYLPRRNYGLVMMGNTDGTSAIVANMLFYHLLDDYLDIPEKERGDVASVFERLILEPKRKELEDPVKALYPDAPTGPNAIPLSLPLDEYTGIYFNLGYRNVTITLVSSDSSAGIHIHPSHHSLQSIIDRTWAYRFSFQHISGEYFIVKGCFPDMPDEEIDMMDPLHVLLLKAEFRLGEDGEVKELGLGFEQEMGEEKIWFRKIEGLS